MVGEARTSDEEDVDKMVIGLSDQARQLDKAAKSHLKRGVISGCIALYGIGIAEILEHAPQVKSYETTAMAVAAGGCALGSLTEYARWTWIQYKARQKRLLATRLTNDSDYLPPRWLARDPKGGFYRHEDKDGEDDEEYDSPEETWGDSPEDEWTDPPPYGDYGDEADPE